MPIKKKLFTSYRLDEEKLKDRSKVLPVRINHDEQQMISDAQKLLNIKSEAKALKICARVGLNVLRHNFGDKILAYLTKESRERLSDYKDLIKLKN